VCTDSRCAQVNSPVVVTETSCSMTIDAPASGRAEVLTKDERWAAWVARGVEHDRKLKKRSIAIACATAAGLALWLAIVLLIG
jgi:hypothetical protein